jgi:hypothetical protein
MPKIKDLTTRFACFCRSLFARPGLVSAPNSATPIYSKISRERRASERGPQFLTASTFFCTFTFLISAVGTAVGVGVFFTAFLVDTHNMHNDASASLAYEINNFTSYFESKAC